MSEQLYKAEFQIDMEDERLTPLGYEIVASAAKWAFKVRVLNWLADNERTNYFVNIYPTNDNGDMVVVLNDRDTAIMLKLALG